MIRFLITNGWATDIDYGDRLYENQFQQAAAFAEEHQLGVYEICGAFGTALGDTHSEPAGDTGTTQQPANNAPAAPTPTPVPAPTPTPVPQPSGECDPSYPSACIPPISQTGDLGCGDVSARGFQVVPPDPHGFDGDGDGVGCEG